MPGKQHRNANPDHTNGKGSHGIRSWSNPTDEAARTSQGVTAGEGICVLQSAGVTPGFYASLGPGLGFALLAKLVDYAAPRTITEDGTALVKDTHILVDSALGTVLLALPTTAAFKFRRMDITHTVPTNILTVDADGAELIQGNATTTLAGDGVIRSITIFSDGVAWFII